MRQSISRLCYDNSLRTPSDKLELVRFSSWVREKAAKFSLYVKNFDNNWLVVRYSIATSFPSNVYVLRHNFYNLTCFRYSIKSIRKCVVPAMMIRSWLNKVNKMHPLPYIRFVTIIFHFYCHIIGYWPVYITNKKVISFSTR